MEVYKNEQVSNKVTKNNQEMDPRVTRSVSLGNVIESGQSTSLGDCAKTETPCFHRRKKSRNLSNPFPFNF